MSLHAVVGRSVVAGGKAPGGAQWVFAKINRANNGRMHRVLSPVTVLRAIRLGNAVFHSRQDDARRLAIAPSGFWVAGHGVVVDSNQQTACASHSSPVGVSGRPGLSQIVQRMATAAIGKNGDAKKCSRRQDCLRLLPGV
jgi:hypothetical protein